MSDDDERVVAIFVTVKSLTFLIHPPVRQLQFRTR
jgi:hypothetical protein